MSMTFYYQMAVFPACLITLMGLFVLRGQDDEKAGRRFLWFLLITNTLLLLIVFLLTSVFITTHSNRAFEMSSLLSPSILGVIVFILLNLKELAGLNPRSKLLAYLLMAGSVVLLGVLWRSVLGIVFYTLPGVIALMVSWKFARRFASSPIVFGLVILVIAILWFPLIQSSRTTPAWMSVIWFLIVFAIPGMLVALPPLLVTTGLSQKGLEEIARFVLAILLLVVLAFIIFWEGVWDQTMDFGMGVFIALIAGSATIVTGMLWTVELRGKFRIVGFLYIILIPTLMYQAYEISSKTSYFTFTENRANRIEKALDRFHAREGYYPDTLWSLVPRDILFIQGPIIIRGENWCYEGARDSYRLAAIYREYWSLPISLHIYASAGIPPEGTWSCEERLARLKPLYDPQVISSYPDTMPTPVPLPTSVVDFPRTVIQPVVSATAIAVGKWSPNGLYLVFGMPEASGNRPLIRLQFLDAETGKVCPTGDTRWTSGFGDDGLASHYAWLPDDRLLYVSDAGEMVIISPCTDGMENISDSYPVTFSKLPAYDDAGAFLLLQNQDGYWLMDGHTLDAYQVASVTPNPYEYHWDQFAWSLDKQHIAISRLNGQDAADGSTLYIIDVHTGEVERSLPLAVATDQSAPHIEWLSQDELLLQSKGTLTIVDLRYDPPRLTDVMKDIFLLDIAYPEDISSMTSLPNLEGSRYRIGVRVNHAHNQGIYLYDSITGQVQTFQYDSDTLFFFPDDQWMELPKFEVEPSYSDQFDLIWVGQPDKSMHLTIKGHTPRSYPKLYLRYLPSSSQLAFGSSQGVSLTSISNGETIGFWQFAGKGSFSTYILPPASNGALAVLAEGDGLYYIYPNPDE
jgi:hypothetical protein